MVRIQSKGAAMYFPILVNEGSQDLNIYPFIYLFRGHRETDTDRLTGRGRWKMERQEERNMSSIQWFLRQIATQLGLNQDKARRLKLQPESLQPWQIYLYVFCVLTEMDWYMLCCTLAGRWISSGATKTHVVGYQHHRWRHKQLCHNTCLIGHISHQDMLTNKFEYTSS